MTKTKIVALLSVIALLASLPLTVALAQEGGAPPAIPYKVVGTAMLDDGAAAEGTMVSAMVGDEKVGSGMVGMDGMFEVDITGGEMGAMVMFSLMMGEGDEMMEYMADTDADVMIGSPGDLKMANLMAYSSAEGRPTAVPPTRSPAQMRGPAGIEGPAGADGADGAAGARGPVGPIGPAGAAGADGNDGNDGARGSAGASGSDGSDGSDGAAGARGPAGGAGPAGADGATGPAGPAGAAGADGGGGVLAIVALIIAIVGVVAAGGAFIAGRQSG